MKIVVPDDYPVVLTGSPAESRLWALGDVAVFTERGAEDEGELIRRVGDADAVINIRAYSKFNETVLENCPRLRVISIWGSGTDNVDIAACSRRGVAVVNTPGVNAHAVAEHTMALMLAVTRRIPAMDRDTRTGEWPRGQLVQLEGKTLGIIGLGAIGRRVARLASAFGMRVLVSTLGSDDGRAGDVGAQHVALETLLRDSDVVSLHLRLSETTAGYLSRSRLALMKPTAFLINTARAGLVDRDGLVDALSHERIAGAGIDVFHEEPVPSTDPLLALPNVVVTPHNAGMTPEVIANGLRQAVDNVKEFFDA